MIDITLTPDEARLLGTVMNNAGLVCHEKDREPIKDLEKVIYSQAVHQIKALENRAGGKS